MNELIARGMNELIARGMNGKRYDIYKRHVVQEERKEFKRNSFGVLKETTCIIYIYLEINSVARSLLA
jgi:hypothetical protein